MNRFIIPFLTVLFFLSVSYSQQFAPSTIYLKAKESNEYHFSTCEMCERDWEGWGVTKGFKKTLTKYEVTTFLKAFKVDVPDLNNIYKVTIKDSLKLNAFVKELNNLPEVEYAEKIPYVKNNYTPNDVAASQWALTKIKAFEAWDITQGTSAVKIAVVDDAVLLTHEDLQDNIWVNPGEIPGNSIDDDNNGYIDDVNGYDVADDDDDPNPPGNAAVGDFTHGTHVAGIASAVTDNGLGVSSLGFNCSIIAVKTKSSGTSGGSLQAPYDGVAYAIAVNADVINMSWGSPVPSNTGQALMDAAHAKGIVLVAAAGNDNSSNYFYPASYEHVISVAATGQADLKASFSNYGDSVDVSAPGVGIYSTMEERVDSYGDLSGTSMAAPFVSALAGLMRSMVPGMDPVEIEECIESTSVFIDHLNSGYAGKLGAGRIDAEAALKCLQIPPVPRFGSDIVTACPGQAVQFNNESIVIDPIAYNWAFPGGTPSSSSQENPLIVYNTPGTYEVSLTITNSYGVEKEVKSGYITVEYPSAIISGNKTIASGSSTQLKIDFTGNPPFSITYTDGTNTFTENNILSSTYYLSVSPLTSSTYQLISMSDMFCGGTVTGTATVDVVNASNSGVCSKFFLYGDGESNLGISHVYHPGENAYYTVTRSDGRKVGIHKFDLNGVRQFSMSHSFGSSSIRIAGMELAPNGELVVGGMIGSDPALMRFDVNGNMLWAKRYRASGVRNSYIAQGLGDTYFLLSWISGPGDDDIFVQHFDGTGNLIWANQYDVNGADDQPVNIIPNGTGGVVVVGEYIPGSKFTVNLFEIDASGALISSFAYPNSGPQRMDKTSGALRLASGETYISGVRLISGTGAGRIHTAFINKLDANGDVIWSREVNNVRREFAFTRLVEDNAGNVYLVTNTDLVTPFGGGTFPVLVVKFDANGNKIWSKALPEIEYVYDISVGVGANEIVISGFTGESNANVGGDDAIFAILDDDLNSCMVQDVVTTPASVTWSKRVDAVNPASVSVTTSTVTASSSPVNFQDVSMCTPLADFDPENVKICVDQLIDFTNKSISATDYEWYIDDVNISANTDLTNQRFSNTGTYKIRLHASAGTCVSIKEGEIEVVDTCKTCGLVADFSGDSILCPGDLASYKDKSYIPPGSTGIQYQWHFGPTTLPPTSFMKDPSGIEFPVPGTYPIILEVRTDCGVDNITKNVVVFGEPDPGPLEDQVLCTNDTYQFTKVTGFDYLWSPSTGLSDSTVSNPVVSLKDTTVEYTVEIISHTTGCSTQKTVEVTALADPNLSVSARDSIICLGEEIALHAVADLKGTFTWNTGQTGKSVVVKPTATSVYQVHFVSTMGTCTADTTHEIVVDLDPSCWEIEIPNVFTPNEDGDNDFFEVVNIDTYPAAKMTIYNRWGNVVWQSDEAYWLYPWDGKRNGKHMPVATYYYVLQLGHGYPNFSGGITLVR